jgi:hypothetical protein
VTLQEQIAEALRLEAEATPDPWTSQPCNNPTCWCEWIDAPPGSDGVENGVCTTGSLYKSDARFIAAARNLVKPLAAAYAASLHALEASDSDRKKLTAKVKELEAALLQQAQDWAGTDTAIRARCGHVDDGYMVPLEDVVGKLAARVKELEAELAKERSDG